MPVYGEEGLFELTKCLKNFHYNSKQPNSRDIG